MPLSTPASTSVLRSLWLTTLQNTQFVVTTLTIFFILRIRSAHAVWFAIGTLVAAFSAKLLKKCIKQPRPSSARKFEKTYGMPSTHSSSISYFGTYLVLSSLWLPLHPRVLSLIPFHQSLLSLRIPRPFQSDQASSSLGELLIRSTLALGFAFSATSVCWSRVKLGHHTVPQVLVGALLGSSVAIVWLSLWIGCGQLPFSSGRAIEPMLQKLGLTWLKNGLSIWGEEAEKLVEDLLLLSLDVWTERDWVSGWHQVKDLFKATWELNRGRSMIGLPGKVEL